MKPCISLFTRRMFEFAGFDWQPRTERFVLASTEAADSDYFSVFNNPRTSAERWHSERIPDVVERVERILRGSALHAFYGEGAQAPAERPETAA